MTLSEYERRAFDELTRDLQPRRRRAARLLPWSGTRAAVYVRAILTVSAIAAIVAGGPLDAPWLATLGWLVTIWMCFLALDPTRARGRPPQTGGSSTRTS